MQQDSNKKIENERPKASGTLKVENSPPTVKRLKIITKSNRNIKMKNQKGKEKVVEKEKALPAFNRDDDSKNSSQLSSDIKELDEPIHKSNIFYLQLALC